MVITGTMITGMVTNWSYGHNRYDDYRDGNKLVITGTMITGTDYRDGHKLVIPGTMITGMVTNWS